MLASNFIKPDITVHLQSENGILGLVIPTESFISLQVSAPWISTKQANEQQ